MIRRRYHADPLANRWSLGHSALQAVRRRGLLYVGWLGVLWATFPLWRWYFRWRPRQFEFLGVRRDYFLHRYNLTWSNERAVEIPLVWERVRAAGGGQRVLEVGDVLSHYVAVTHEVLDKFERGCSIHHAEDVTSFRSPRRYDLIVSISTLEHVGWDEEPQDPAKIGRAVANLAAHLAPGGCLLATLPLGYNPWLDAQLAASEMPFDRVYYLRRTGLLHWVEASWQEVAGSSYGRPWPAAGALAIGILEA